MTDLNQGRVEPQSPFGVYPAQQGGYPPQQGGYPPQPGGYPPQPGGYPPQHPPHVAVQAGVMPPVKSPVAALVCGILSWVPGFGWFTAVPAIVLGVKGRRAAREGRTPNGGMATTGLWLGIVNMVVTLMVGILVAMAIPVFLNQRHKGVEASLKSDLKNMAVMQETYIQDHPETLGVAVPATSPGGRVTAPVVFTSSAGNVIAVVVGPDGYCVSGYNPQASVAISPSASKLFRSNEGGLQAEVGTC